MFSAPCLVAGANHAKGQQIKLKIESGQMWDIYRPSDHINSELDYRAAWQAK